MRARYWLLGLLAAALFACGSNSGTNDAGGGGGDDDSGSGGGGDDGGGVQGCTATGSTQCSDCVDNDMDGRVDGFDPECTGPADNDESSFKTGLPGDNSDPTKQDCFFDGNSGQGGGDCDQHVCCLLQAPDIATCETILGMTLTGPAYDPTKCYKPFGTVDVPAGCAANCGPLSPPGCDCFGCCTVCQDPNDVTSCRDIIVNAAVSPMCDSSNITDNGMDGTDNTGDEPCKRCVKNTDCGDSTPCNATDPTSCVLCPGQDPSTLPPSCNGGTCPDGVMECDATTGACPEGTYCTNGCCVGIIQ